MQPPRFPAAMMWVVALWFGWASPTAEGASPLSAAEARLLEQMAREGTNVTLLYALGDTCHDAGVEGDKPAVGRAEGYLRQLLTIAPSNAPALALLGSVYTLKGRDAFWPTTQLKLVREGNEYMDRAVQLDPQGLRTRLTRAFNNAHMPDFLGRSEVVIADLQWLWVKVEKEPDTMTASQRQQIALHWGRRLKRQSKADEARRVLDTGLAFAPQSSLGQQISAELAKLR